MLSTIGRRFNGVKIVGAYAVEHAIWVSWVFAQPDAVGMSREPSQAGMGHTANNAARTLGMMLLRVMQMLDIEQFTDRTHVAVSFGGDCG